jgi:HD superfamily phosphodiesterase
MDNIIEFQYVKELFDENTTHREKFGFRDKFEHTKRVYMWANRLLEQEKADKEVVLMAVIFHDVGYLFSDKEHPRYSAEICREYLEKAHYNHEFIDKVADIIANHGNKELLDDPNTSMEQIILIEADCLDESGAMSVLRDAISEGVSGVESYNKVYKRLCERSIIKKQKKFRCVTVTAKKFWLEKQKLYLSFLNSLKNDLGETDDF